MLSSRSSKPRSTQVKSLGSRPMEEAKSPESETVAMSVKASRGTKALSVPKEKGARSSPLSRRAQKVKDNLRKKCVVKAVLLKSDGSSEEIDYNTSSKQANQLVNGRPTIVGELEDLNVLIVRALNQSGGVMNPHVLPVPFCNKQYFGHYLLYRIDSQGNAIHLTLKQYEKFVADNKTLTENARKNYDPVENQEIKTKSLFSSNSKLTLIYLRSEVDRKIRAEFEQSNGRKPSDSEIEASVDEALQNLVNELASRSSRMNDPDYDPKEDGATFDADMLDSLKRIYLEENGVDLQNNELFGTLRNTQNLLRDAQAAETTVDDRDWRLQLNDALNYVRERGRLDGRILAEKISETFYELNGREPSLNELVDVFRRIKAELAEEAAEDAQAAAAMGAASPVDNGTALFLARKLGASFQDADPSDLIDVSFRIVGQDLVSRARSSFMICKGREPNDAEMHDAVQKLALKLADRAIASYNNRGAMMVMMAGAGAGASAAASNAKGAAVDADYDPNNAADAALTKSDEMEDEEWNSSNFSMKMLTTQPVASRLGRSTTYDVYFNRVSARRERKNLAKAIESFKKRNRRQPTVLEINRLKQFLFVQPQAKVIRFELSVVNKPEEEQKQPVSESAAAMRNKETVGRTTPSKVLVTPVKKKKSAARYNVYFEDDKEKLDQMRNERLAIKWFKRFNNREPTKLELAGIKQFTRSDKSELTEMEYDVPVFEDDDAKQTELDDMMLKKLKTDSVVTKGRSTKYTLNFNDDEERANGDEKQAIKWFKRFNNREPREDEREKIAQFVQADRVDTIDVD